MKTKFKYKLHIGRPDVDNFKLVDIEIKKKDAKLVTSGLGGLDWVECDAISEGSSLKRINDQTSLLVEVVNPEN